MTHYTFAGIAAALIVGGLIGSAPPASAGCMYGGDGAYSRCDDPVQPVAPGNVAWTTTRLSANRPFTCASSAAF